MNVRCQSCETVFRVDPAKVPTGGVRARCTVCSATISVSVSAEAPEGTSPEREGVATGLPEAAARTPTPRAAPPPPAEPDVEVPSLPVEPAAPAEPVPEPAAPPGPRLSAPFIPPREPRAAPVPRPSAPVFRPTPGQPVQPAAPPPAPDVEPIPAPVTAAPAAPAAPPAAPQPAPASVPQAPTAAPAPAAPKKPINPFLAQDPKQKARRLARALVSDMIVYQPEKRQKAMADGNLKQAFEDEIQKSWEEYVEQVGEEMATSSEYWTDALNEILAGGQKVF